MERIGATCKKQSLLVIIKFDRSSKQVDHMNGLKDDVENIRFLCANCHTQNSNWGWKHSRKHKNCRFVKKALVAVGGLFEYENISCHDTKCQCTVPSAINKSNIEIWGSGNRPPVPLVVPICGDRERERVSVSSLQAGTQKGPPMPRPCAPGGFRTRNLHLIRVVL